jgi:hypothetical protein
MPMPYLQKQYQQNSLESLKIIFLNTSVFITRWAIRSALLRRIRGRFLQLYPPRLAYQPVNNPG